MSKNIDVVEKLIEMKSDNDNYIYLHGDTNSKELTFVVRGEADVLVSALLQTFEENKNILNIMREAVGMYDLSINRTFLN